MSEPVSFSLPSTCTKVAMRADRSVAVTVVSEQAIPEDEFHVMHRAFQQAGVMAWVGKGADAPPPPKQRDGIQRKSPGQQLRAALFRLHEAIGGNPDDFEQWYAFRCERWRQEVLAELREYDE